MGCGPPTGGPHVHFLARFGLDHCPDPAVALVIRSCALGEIALAHLRDVVRGVGEFEQGLEACEVRGKLTLPVLGYCPKLLREPGGDVVQARGVEADDLPRVVHRMSGTPSRRTGLALSRLARGSGL